MIAGRFGDGGARRAALGDKYEVVQARVNELMGGGSASCIPAAGGAFGGGRCTVVCDRLNVRSAPSLAGAIVASYGYGESINAVSADTVCADGYRWAHYVGYSGMMRYVAVGAADGSEVYLVRG